MYASVKKAKRTCLVAGALVLTTMSHALGNDTRITVDRQANSPLMNVKYSGANVALVELLINGKTVGTKEVSAAKNAGETEFSLDLSELKDGENALEVRLYDRVGRLVGTEKSVFLAETSDRGPVALSSPSMGSTVQGPVEIKLEFRRSLKNPYVSFFINGTFKSMTNFAPYSYVWDTVRETNGWQEVEAWVVDETSATYKTRKVRVFVNNSAGRTDRKPVKTPSVLVTDSSAKGPKVQVKPTEVKAKVETKAVSKSAKAPAKVAKLPKQTLPAISKNVDPIKNADISGKTVVVRPNAQDSSKKTANVIIAKENLGTIEISAPKPEAIPSKVARVIPVQMPKVSAIKNVVTASSLLTVTRGFRMNTLSTFAVVLNSKFVQFDVPTRVDGGVPMTPFRHLIESAGGKVEWESFAKSVSAMADGNNIFFQIGDKTAKVNEIPVTLELAPYVDRGRTIVPLSFVRDSLKVDIQFDKKTGHVLITSQPKVK